MFSILYILCIVFANLTAGNIVGFNGFYFAVGTLFFGAIFTLRDILHTRLGKKETYKIIFLAVLVNTIISLLGAFDLRILIASVIAMLLSESMDTEIFHALKNKHYLLRVVSSNVISLCLDTLLFTFIAFYGIWGIDMFITVVFGDIIIKLIISTCIIPLYVRVKNGIS